MSSELKLTESGLPYLLINEEKFSGQLFLNGAHLTSFYSKTLKREMFWMLPGVTYQSGQATRGGVPVVFPWFGKREDTSLPQHGFARNLSWELTEHGYDPQNKTYSATLEVSDSPVTHSLWKHSFHATLQIILSERQVEYRISVKNTGKKHFDCEVLLHPYFNIENVKNVSVQNLSDAIYHDKVNHSSETQQGDVRFEGTTDRIYESELNSVTISENHVMLYRVQKPAVKHVVIWNPGSGFGSGENAPPFVCVEPGRILSDHFSLDAGKSDDLVMIFEMI